MIQDTVDFPAPPLPTTRTLEPSRGSNSALVPITTTSLPVPAPSHRGQIQLTSQMDL